MTHVLPVLMRIISGTTMMTSINGQIDAIAAKDDSVTWRKLSLDIGEGLKEFLRGLARALQEGKKGDECYKTNLRGRIEMFGMRT
jgi:hypothetical protein